MFPSRIVADEGANHEFRLDGADAWGGPGNNADHHEAYGTPTGNTLVTNGWIENSKVFEVTPNGTRVLEIRGAHLPIWIDRADRIPSLYPLRCDADGDDDDLHAAQSGPGTE